MSRGRPPKWTCRVKHGSQPLSEKRRCQYCKLNKAENYTKRRCCDCDFHSPLCQTVKRNCHELWHQPSFDEVRDLWFEKKALKSQIVSGTGTQTPIQFHLQQAVSWWPLTLVPPCSPVLLLHLTWLLPALLSEKEDGPRGQSTKETRILQEVTSQL